MPRLAAIWTVWLLNSPPGLRKYLIGTPGTIAWIASLVRCISALIWSGVRVFRPMSWDQVWLHRVWPSATIRLITSGYSATCLPITQNVALTCCLASRSRKAMEYTSGPSSKVSATASEPVPVREPAGPRFLGVLLDGARVDEPDWDEVAVGDFGAVGR